MAARAGYRRAFQVGSVRDHALEIRHRDGHLTPVLYNAAVYRDETGNVAGVFAAARDITERKRVEDALHTSHELLDNINRSSPSSIFATDRQHRFNMTNQAHLLIWEITEDQLLGHTELEAFPRGTAERLWADNEEIMRTGRTLQIEEELHLADGTTVVVVVTKFPLRDKDLSIRSLQTDYPEF